MRLQDFSFWPEIQACDGFINLLTKNTYIKRAPTLEGSIVIPCMRTDGSLSTFSISFFQNCSLEDGVLIYGPSRIRWAPFKIVTMNL